MSDESVLAQLSEAFTRLGADGPQARVMAGQLLKRARQVAREKQIPEEEALAELLAKVAAGRRGEYSG